MAKKMKFDYPYFEDFGGSTKKILRHVIPEQPVWSATNPSIGYCPKQGYAMTLRSSNYKINPQYGTLDLTIGDKVRAYVWFSELNEQLVPINLRQIDLKDSNGPEIHRGIEDARLFSRDGQWYFTGVMLENHTPRARLVLYKLDTEKNKAEFIRKYDSWETERVEKNWMLPALEDNPNFDFVYTGDGIYKNGKFILDPVLNDDIASMRGGSCLWPLDDGSYIAVTHCMYARPVQFYDKNRFGNVTSAIRNYTHQFVRFSNTGKILEMSDEFIFDHPGIEFAAGLVEKNGYFIVSYGNEDIAACLATIPKQTALNLLHPVRDEEPELEEAESFDI